MSDFHAPWELSRSRFVAEIEGLSASQLNWRIQPGALTLGEAALHVAGVEASFGAQLTGVELSPLGGRLRLAATEGVVNDAPFPFAGEEITPKFVEEALAYSRTLVEPMLLAPSPELLAKEIKSALGPIITGRGALTRFAFHAA